MVRKGNTREQRSNSKAESEASDPAVDPPPLPTERSASGSHGLCRRLARRVGLARSVMMSVHDVVSELSSCGEGESKEVIGNEAIERTVDRARRNRSFVLLGCPVPPSRSLERALWVRSCSYVGQLCIPALRDFNVAEDCPARAKDPCARAKHKHLRRPSGDETCGPSPDPSSTTPWARRARASDPDLPLRFSLSELDLSHAHEMNEQVHIHAPPSFRPHPRSFRPSSSHLINLALPAR